MKVSQLTGSTLRQAEGYSPGMTFLLRAGYIRKPMPDATVLLSLGQNLMDNIITSLTGIPPLKDASRVNVPVLYTDNYWAKVGISEVLPHDPTTLFVHTISSRNHLHRQLPITAHKSRPGSPSAPAMMDIWVVGENREYVEDKMGDISNAFFHVFMDWRLLYDQALADPGLGMEGAGMWLFRLDSGKTSCLMEGDSPVLFEPSVCPVLKENNKDEAPLPVEKVYTPSTASITELAAFLGVPASRTSKVVFFTGKVLFKKHPQLIVAVIRGDREV
ncbi:MAG: YbaK/EbsC family protein [Bacteroidia bacterium]